MSKAGKPILYEDFKSALERAAFERNERHGEEGFEHQKRDAEVLDRLVLLFDAGRNEIMSALRTASSRLNRGA